MTESQWTSQKLLPALRAKMPEAEIWKVNDATASGRPDVQVCLEGFTTYFEVKVREPFFRPLQYETLRRLQCAYYLIWYDEDASGVLIPVVLPWTDALQHDQSARIFVESHEDLKFDSIITKIHERCLR